VKRAIPASSAIPDKVYFRIAEVSQLVGVDAHVLRYWETEFSFIKPFRGKSKQRLYRRQDVEKLLQIRELLHRQGFTINGARNYLKALDKRQSDISNLDELKFTSSQNNMASLLAEIKGELLDIVVLLAPVKIDGSSGQVDKG
jgi:DNA-binding transcriptional MerR regulator